MKTLWSRLLQRVKLKATGKLTPAIRLTKLLGMENKIEMV